MVSGTQYRNRKQRRVSSLASNALKSPRMAQLIYRLVRDTRPGTVLELGTCLGITTLYLAKAQADARVITIEGCPQTAAVAREVFRSAKAGQIESLTGNFDEVLPGLLKTLPSLEVLFVDGNHRRDATLNCFERGLRILHEGSVHVFDDIHWSKGMEEAWERIKAHPA